MLKTQKKRVKEIVTFLPPNVGHIENKNKRTHRMFRSRRAISSSRKEKKGLEGLSAGETLATKEEKWMSGESCTTQIISYLDTPKILHQFGKLEERDQERKEEIEKCD